ncbi:MAG: hypothetical protein K2K05_10250, partial [Muribaculaceae bacterium]|nr:hypothetical protein [Muribaculaceae bacterium]
VLKISEGEAECQFAEGRCAQTLEDPFEDVYVSGLDLGSPTVTDPTKISPLQAWKSIDDGASEVALPWVNENSPTAPNNWVNYSGGSYSWDAEVSALSWQPYLIVIAKRICEAVGYEHDFSEWEESEMRHLIVCNAIPGGWGMHQYARVMPGWTVSEFFAKLELFLMCEFDFDHKAKSVRMRFSKNAIEDIDPVAIDDVVDSYSVEVSQSDDTQCNYIATKRIAYKECSHPMWNFYCCDWFVEGNNMMRYYNTLAELIQKNKCRVSEKGGETTVEWGQPLWDGLQIANFNTVNSLLYAKDVDTWYVFRAIGKRNFGKVSAPLYVLQPVNVFGSGSSEKDSDGSEEIEFVPACVMDTYVAEDDDKGYMLFLNPSFSEQTGGMSYCSLLYTSPSPRAAHEYRRPSSAWKKKR